MKDGLVFERRASTVLFHLLRSLRDRRPWLLPANVCPIVPLIFFKAGCPFELVDIHPRSLCLDPVSTLERLRRAPGRHAGVLFVHTYGGTSKVGGFFAEIRRAVGDRGDLCLVDDRCLNPPDPDGPLVQGADVVLYSTGYAKYVDLGMGGFARLREGVPYRRRTVPFDPEALERVERSYKAAVVEHRPLKPDTGCGPWLETMPPEADWETYRSRVLEARRVATAHKERLNSVYRRGIPTHAALAERFHAWRFQVRVPDPEAVVAALDAEGLFAGRHYASLGGVFAPGSFPVAEDLHRRIVNLFNDRYYTEDRARATAAVVARHLDGVPSGTAANESAPLGGGAAGGE